MTGHTGSAAGDSRDYDQRTLMKERLIRALCLAALLSFHSGMQATYAADDHDHHDEAEGHGHEDGHAHDDHEDHAEGTARIVPEAAQKAGIVIAKAQIAPLEEHLTLTGRIGQNRDTSVSVPARFPAVIKQMHVTWGQAVTAGQVLATLESRANPTRYDITAPVSGVILERKAGPGDIVTDEAVFVIADLSDVWAEFHVFPRDLPRIAKDLQVHVKALESDQETTAPITTVMPTADAFSQTVIAVVTLPNRDGIWRPGMTVEGDVHLTEKGRTALVVEQAAIQRMEDKSVVFVRDGDRYAMRPVILGGRDDRYVEVLEGLKEGEEYVAQGSFIVKADIAKAQAGHDHAH